MRIQKELPASTSSGAAWSAIAHAAPRTRTDAVRNHENLLIAADALLATHGANISVTDIARRAGVSKSTVYRCFATKSEIISTIAGAHYDAWATRARSGLLSPDASRVLTEVTLAHAELVGRHRLMLELLFDPQLAPPDVRAARWRLDTALGALLSAGHAQRTLRADVSTDDLTLLLAGVCSVLAEQREQDPARWQRAARLVVDALRQPGEARAVPATATALRAVRPTLDREPDRAPPAYPPAPPREDPADLSVFLAALAEQPTPDASRDTAA